MQRIQRAKNPPLFMAGSFLQLRISRLGQGEQKNLRSQTSMMQCQCKITDEKKPPAGRWRFHVVAWG
jgi:hypothetical protein